MFCGSLVAKRDFVRSRKGEKLKLRSLRDRLYEITIDCEAISWWVMKHITIRVVHGAKDTTCLAIPPTRSLCDSPTNPHALFLTLTSLLVKSGEDLNFLERLCQKYAAEASGRLFLASHFRTSYLIPLLRCTHQIDILSTTRISTILLRLYGEQCGELGAVLACVT